MIITKSDLMLRDLDLFGQMADWNGCLVYTSITTLDPDIAQAIEPRASTPGKRIGAIRSLSEAGIPVGVLAAPIVPGLTDHEIPAILEAGAGARYSGYIPLRLPHGVGDLFEAWLEEYHPGKKEKVLQRIRSIRGGRRNDPDFGTRMLGEGAYAREMEALFKLGCRKGHLSVTSHRLSVSEFRRPECPQGRLFT